MANYCMILLVTLLIVVVITIFLMERREVPIDFEFVTRNEWKARDPVHIEKMKNPVPYVIIHHSYIPKACNTSDHCIEAMLRMQSMHIDTNKWNDIGYSFAVGGDGKVYEGRGWSRVGAHAPTYNNKSIGICIIGDWSDDLPPENQLETVHKLIQYGVDLGMIQRNYSLFGHRQVREGTECPGEALFEEINNWAHFCAIAPYVYPDKSNNINR
ncbi:peptidoglycan-recognition protein LB isoform X2 [Agrilus planipennis]|uniref:Peptidoglycan-recognition protein n=1 Tax=Agrilus planipennis TaxID=224129 RepID=A0A1W4XWP1_AGRPL|nr:peptidoglycan-recognition protein LB isoform X2 [Agrilus planipennis]